MKVHGVRFGSLRMMSFAAAFVAAFLSLACDRGKSDAPPPTPVRVLAVQPGSMTSGFKYSASFVPRAQVEMAFKVGGYVEAILQVPGPDGKLRDVQPGDLVKAGALLARVRVSDYVAQSSQARGVLGEAQAQMRQAQLDYQRAAELVKGGYISQSEFDRATEMLSVAKSKVEQTRSALESADIQLGDTELKSPMDCFVVKRQVELGTLVKAGTLAFVLSDLSSVKAQFGVPDTALSLVKAGDSLSVTVEALGNKSFQGTVLSVSPSADAKSRVFNVDVEVQNPGFELKEGMIAQVTLGDGKTAAPAGMVVPLSAVVRPPDGADGYMVWLVSEKDGKPIVTGRKVQLGAVKGDAVAITDGVAAGERVVVSGASQVFEGQTVNIIP
ncbi:efflux RND transporter periplasmic adaptor subunit [Desulfovibrio aminophilus]|uniref:efflux RND transporter periplasmic adaptor subunit n=1 Tax=Desulfovibrio aminophilus TaxID=81425 RepID=UPI003396C69A